MPRTQPPAPALVLPHAALPAPPPPARTPTPPPPASPCARYRSAPCSPRSGLPPPEPPHPAAGSRAQSVTCPRPATPAAAPTALRPERPDPGALASCPSDRRKNSLRVVPPSQLRPSCPPSRQTDPVISRPLTADAYSGPAACPGELPRHRPATRQRLPRERPAARRP